MKKILLATSVLVSLGAASAYADGLTIKPVGKFNAQMGFAGQKIKNPTKTYDGSYDPINDVYVGSTYSDSKKAANKGANVRTEIGLKADGMTDAGIHYGGLVLFENTNDDLSENQSSSAAIYSKSSNIKLKRSYVYGATEMGKIELGANEGAEESMKIGADSIAVGTGGIDGDFDQFINKSGSATGKLNTYAAATGTSEANNGWYLLAPSIHGMHDSKLRRANKVTYYSPKVSGFQLGVSYTPDYQSHGNNSFSNKYMTTSDTSGNPNYGSFTNQVRDIVSGAIGYSTQMNEFGFAASVSGVTGTAKKAFNSTGASQNYRDLKAVAGGVKVTYRNFSLAGSYADLGKSLVRKDFPVAAACTTVSSVRCNENTNKTKTNNFWTAGVAYNQGPIGASVTYMGSNRWGNEAAIVSVGVDYMLAPGFTPYAEYTNFDLRSKADHHTAGGPRTKNRGNVVILGTTFTF